MTTIVISGANRGIGLEMARQFKARGDTVIALVRTTSDELDALGVETVTDVDVTQDDLSFLTRHFQDRRIDILVNNAGVLKRTSLNELNLDAVRQQFEVNTLGPLKLTAALRPNLGAGAKVVHVTSRMGSIADNDSGSHYGYRMSKAALNCAAKSMSVDLASADIAVCVLHPGWVRTDMTGHNGLVDPPESARGLIQRIDELQMATTGSFWHQNGDSLPW